MHRGPICQLPTDPATRRRGTPKRNVFRTTFPFLEPHFVVCLKLWRCYFRGGTHLRWRKNGLGVASPSPLLSVGLSVPLAPTPLSFHSVHRKGCVVALPWTIAEKRGSFTRLPSSPHHTTPQERGMIDAHETTKGRRKVYLPSSSSVGGAKLFRAGRCALRPVPYTS